MSLVSWTNHSKSPPGLEGEMPRIRPPPHCVQLMNFAALHLQFNCSARQIEKVYTVRAPPSPWLHSVVIAFIFSSPHNCIALMTDGQNMGDVIL